MTVRQEVPDMFGGTLYVVSWFSTKDNRDFESLVFIDKAAKAHFFFNPTELTRYLNQNHADSGAVSMLGSGFSPERIPAMIAILITLTICYLVIARDLKDVPTVLGNALSSILGFYFGSRVTEGKSDGGSAGPKRGG